MQGSSSVLVGTAPPRPVLGGWLHVAMLLRSSGEAWLLADGAPLATGPAPYAFALGGPASVAPSGLCVGDLQLYEWRSDWDPSGAASTFTGGACSRGDSAFPPSLGALERSEPTGAGYGQLLGPGGGVLRSQWSFGGPGSTFALWVRTGLGAHWARLFSVRGFTASLEPHGGVAVSWPGCASATFRSAGSPRSLAAPGLHHVAVAWGATVAVYADGEPLAMVEKNGACELRKSLWPPVAANASLHFGDLLQGCCPTAWLLSAQAFPSVWLPQDAAAAFLDGGPLDSWPLQLRAWPSSPPQGAACGMPDHRFAPGAGRGPLLDQGSASDQWTAAWDGASVDVGMRNVSGLAGITVVLRAAFDTAALCGPSGSSFRLFELAGHTLSVQVQRGTNCSAGFSAGVPATLVRMGAPDGSAEATMGDGTAARPVLPISSTTTLTLGPSGARVYLGSSPWATFSRVRWQPPSQLAPIRASSFVALIDLQLYARELSPAQVAALGHGIAC